eukprot:6209011-Pleurochrysis_carterae.AAC.3
MVCGSKRRDKAAARLHEQNAHEGDWLEARDSRSRIAVGRLTASAMSPKHERIGGFTSRFKFLRTRNARGRSSTHVFERRAPEGGMALACCEVGGRTQGS